MTNNALETSSAPCTQYTTRTTKRSIQECGLCRHSPIRIGSLSKKNKANSQEIYIHSRVKCETDNCTKWKAYIEKELDVTNDAENHHKGEFFLSKKHMAQQAVRLKPNTRAQKIPRITNLPDPATTDASIILELSAQEGERTSPRPIMIPPHQASQLQRWQKQKKRPKTKKTIQARSG